MHTLYVELGEQRYPIFIGADLLGNSALLCDKIRGQQLMIVSNTTVARLHLTALRTQFSAYSCDTVLLQDGEHFKNLDELNKIFDQLIAQQHTRRTTLIALGGGVITDMTGFAAACYLRGVDYIQIPTTLLAQADASIGGKTGINHPAGKNLIGAFYQPRAVYIDVNVLKTLPPREFTEGLAEVIKYGLIHDAQFFGWLETHIDALLAREPAALIEMITRSCQIKAKLVVADERERKDIRVLLNLGHTFAHAIETGLGYGVLLHGEAVAIGLALAAELSARMGWLPPEQVARIKALLIKTGLPAGLPAGLSVTQMLVLMAGDKKNINGRLRLVLLKAIGHACVTERVMQNTLEELLADYLAKDVIQ